MIIWGSILSDIYDFNSNHSILTIFKEADAIYNSRVACHFSKKLKKKIGKSTLVPLYKVGFIIKVFRERGVSIILAPTINFHIYNVLQISTNIFAELTHNLHIKDCFQKMSREYWRNNWRFSWSCLSQKVSNSCHMENGFENLA